MNVGSINIDWVAIYAALVATIALGWRIFEWIHQRPKIKVKMEHVTNYVSPNNSSFIVTTAMNTGHYPITICAAGIHISGLRGACREMDVSESEESGSKNFPKRLQEGERVEKIYKCRELKQTLQENGSKAYFHYAWFRDATDRIYSIRFHKDAIRMILS